MPKPPSALPTQTADYLTRISHALSTSAPRASSHLNAHLHKLRQHGAVAAQISDRDDEEFADAHVAKRRKVSSPSDARLASVIAECKACHAFLIPGWGCSVRVRREQTGGSRRVREHGDGVCADDGSDVMASRKARTRRAGKKNRRRIGADVGEGGRKERDSCAKRMTVVTTCLNCRRDDVREIEVEHGRKSGGVSSAEPDQKIVQGVGTDRIASETVADAPRGGTGARVATKHTLQAPDLESQAGTTSIAVVEQPATRPPEAEAKSRNRKKSKGGGLKAMLQAEKDKAGRRDGNSGKGFDLMDFMMSG